MSRREAIAVLTEIATDYAVSAITRIEAIKVLQLLGAF